MRYLWTLIASSIPLAFFTLLSIGPLFKSDDDPVVQQTRVAKEVNDLKVEKDKAGQVAKKLRHDQSLVKGLRDATKLGEKLGSPDATDDSLKQLPPRWDMIGKIGKLASSLPPRSADPSREKKDWEDFLTEYRSDLTEIDKRLVRELELRIEDYKKQIATHKELDELRNTATKGYEAALEWFNREDFEAALKELNKLGMAGMDGDPLLDKIKVLRKRAEFYRDLRAAKRRLEDQEKLDALRRIVDQYGRAPSDLDTGAWKDLVKQRDDLECVIRLNELSSKPPEGVVAYFRAAMQVQDLQPTSQLKRELRDMVRRWVVKHLADKDLADWADVKDAEDDKGRPINGIFKPDPEKPNKYHYSKTAKDPEETKYASELKKQPQDSLPLRCLQEYRKLRERIAKDPLDRSEWENLVKVCERQEKELVDYKNKGLMQEREKVSFTKELDFAEELLREWRTFEALLK